MVGSATHTGHIYDAVAFFVVVAEYSVYNHRNCLLNSRGATLSHPVSIKAILDPDLYLLIPTADGLEELIQSVPWCCGTTQFFLMLIAV